jgi:hypothetical protein
MRLYAVQTADSGDLAALRDAARDGRAAAMARRRALAAGKSASALAHERVRTAFRESELRPAAAARDALPASSDQGAPSGAQAPADTAVADDGVAAARLGRALSMQRRRQMYQGKQALTGADARGFIVHRGGAR